LGLGLIGGDAGIWTRV